MNTESTSNNHEMLSALADGQLRGTAFAQAVDLVLRDAEVKATWHSYHVIGDVLRSRDLAACGGDSAFLARLQTKLAKEPGFARPKTLTQPTAHAAELPSVATLPPRSALETQRRAAANESGFRWKLVAGFASMAAVAAIGWNLVGAPGVQPAAQQIAAAGAPVQVANNLPRAVQEPAGPVVPVAAQPASPTVASGNTTRAVMLANGEPQVMIRDPRLDELMAAHKQFGGTSALQMPAGFLRNATFEGPAR